MRKKLILVGRSLALILDKPLCAVLGIERNSVLSISIDQGAIIIRPIGVTKKHVPRGTSSVKPRELPPTRALIGLLRSLDAWGMTKQHFQRLSHDAMGLGEFHGAVSLGERVDPVTIERLKSCLTRRETCKESWDASIDAVVAVRVPESDGDLARTASGPRPTEGATSDIGSG